MFARYPRIVAILSRLMIVPFIGGLLLLCAQPIWGQEAEETDSPMVETTENSEQPSEPSDPPRLALPDVENPNMETFPETLKNGFLFGKELMEQENYGKALMYFNATLSQHNRFASAYFFKGIALARLGNRKKAIESLSKAAINGKIFPKVFFEMGNIHFENGEVGRNSRNIEDTIEGFQNAVENFGTALELRPTNPEYMHHLGRALANLGSVDSAGAYAFGEAQENLLRGNTLIGNAIDIFERIKQQESNEETLEEVSSQLHQAYFDRAIARSELGLTDDSLEDLENAIQLDPENLKYTEILAGAYVQHARRQAVNDPDEPNSIIQYIEQAVEKYTFVLDRAPSVPEEDNGQQTDDNIPPYTDARLAGIYSTRADVRIFLATYLPADQREQQYLAAINDCESALKLDKNHIAGHFYLGVAQRMLENFRGAIDSFTKVLEINPNEAEARLRRAIVIYHLGQYDLALTSLEYFTGDSNDPRPHFWKGLVHARQGDYAEAVESYSEAIGINDAYLIAYGNRGLAYLHLGEYQRAIKDFNALILHDQTDAQSHYRRGVALEQLGENERAVKAYDQTLYWNPEFDAARRRLDRLTEHRKKRQEKNGA